MKKGIHCDKIYSSKVTWLSLRMFFILKTIYGWKTQELDFAMAYMQLTINKTTYMELTKGINFQEIIRETHCLRMIKNIYGRKESEGAWFNLLKINSSTNSNIQNQHMMNASSIRASPSLWLKLMME
jgi:hypothetical protein